MIFEIYLSWFNLVNEPLETNVIESNRIALEIQKQLRVFSTQLLKTVQSGNVDSLALMVPKGNTLNQSHHLTTACIVLISWFVQYQQIGKHDSSISNCSSRLVDHISLLECFQAVFDIVERYYATLSGNSTTTLVNTCLFTLSSQSAYIILHDRLNLLACLLSECVSYSLSRIEYVMPELISTAGHVETWVNWSAECHIAWHRSLITCSSLNSLALYSPAVVLACSDSWAIPVFKLLIASFDVETSPIHFEIRNGFSLNLLSNPSISRKKVKYSQPTNNISNNQFGESYLLPISLSAVKLLLLLDSAGDKPSMKSNRICQNKALEMLELSLISLSKATSYVRYTVYVCMPTYTYTYDIHYLYCMSLLCMPTYTYTYDIQPVLYASPS